MSTISPEQRNALKLALDVLLSPRDAVNLGSADFLTAAAGLLEGGCDEFAVRMAARTLLEEAILHEGYFGSQAKP
jgi:hypothetical protein